MSKHLPTWLKSDYNVIVTSDHGVSDDGMHGGSSAEETEVTVLAV